MNTVQILLIVLAVILFAAIVLAVLLPFLKRKGVAVDSVLEYTKSALATANRTLDMARPFLSDSPGLTLFDKILTAVQVGVGNAEQLYHVGKLEGEQRNDEARKYILDSLGIIGIEVTPEIERVIDGAIEAEVLNLGHTDKQALAN